MSQPPADLDARYARLGKATASEVFPIRFAADVPVVNGPFAGEIEGFMVLDDLRSRRTRALR